MIAALSGVIQLHAMTDYAVSHRATQGYAANILLQMEGLMRLASAQLDAEPAAAFAGATEQEVANV